MSNEECAKLLIEMHSDYFDLANKYGETVLPEYAEAVAKAILGMQENK